MKFKVNRLYQLALWTSTLGVLGVILDFGYNQSESVQEYLDRFYFFVITIGLISTFTRYSKNTKLISRRVFIFDLLSVLYSLYILYLYVFIGQAFKTDFLLENPIWLIIAVALSFFREIFEVKLGLSLAILNPAQLFIISFLIIIFSGALMLMLPNASTEKLSFLDALFTST